MTTPIRPEDVLPDEADSATFGGTTARKGTVAAFVANAKVLDDLSEGSPEWKAVVDQLRSLVPGLRAVGALDVFVPRSSVIAALTGEPTSGPVADPQAGEGRCSVPRPKVRLRTRLGSTVRSRCQTPAEMTHTSPGPNAITSSPSACSNTASMAPVWQR